MSAKTLGDELHDENAQAAWKREMEKRQQARRYAIYYPQTRSKPYIIEVDDRGKKIRYIAEFYIEEDAQAFIDAMNRVGGEQ